MWLREFRIYSFLLLHMILLKLLHMSANHLYDTDLVILPKTLQFNAFITLDSVRCPFTWSGLIILKLKESHVASEKEINNLNFYNTRKQVGKNACIERAPVQSPVIFGFCFIFIFVYYHLLCVCVRCPYVYSFSGGCDHVRGCDFDSFCCYCVNGQ